MKDKLGAAFFCLIFVAVFGGVGLGATWVIGTTVYDGLRARDWVRVKAMVDSVEETAVSYRYTFQGREYAGDRLGAVPIGGRDNVDDWGEELYERLSAAKAAQRPITVLVDPAKPSDSMVDAEIRWRLLVFLLPFSLAFGGVGLGALYMLTRVFRDAPKMDPRSPKIASDARGGIAALWIFGFFWNAISFPVALLFVPRMIDEGEWLGLLVMIFPLVGVFLLWSALRSTWGYLRRGGATLKLRAGEARAGSSLEGTVELARGVKMGDAFRVNLLCRRSASQGGDANVSTRWTKHVDARAAAAPGGGARVAFRFEVPAHLPATGEDEHESFAWRIEVSPTGQPLPVPYGFDVDMQPAPAASPAAAAGDAPRVHVFAGDEMPATLGPGFESVEKLLGLNASHMSSRQRAALASMTPEQKAALAKFAAFGPAARNAMIVVVCIFAAIIVIPFIIAIFSSF